MAKAYEKIYNIIREQILDDNNIEMVQLPPERILCETYGVSRITIRQALKMLQDQGLIERLPGKGTFIKRGQEKKIPILESSYERAFANIMPKISREVISWEALAPPKEIGEAMGLLKSEECLTFQRIDFQSGAPLSYDKCFIPLQYSSTIDESIINEVDFLSSWVKRENLAISYYKLEIEAAIATEEDAKILHMPIGSPVLHTTDTFHTAEGKVVAIFITMYRGDKFTITSTERVNTFTFNPRNAPLGPGLEMG